MAVRFDKKWFNPLYFVLNEIIKDPTIRKVLVYGGKSSSKTVSICQVLAKECFIRAANTIAFRKESAIIPTTLKKSFNLSIDTLRLNPVYERQDRKYLCTHQNLGQSEIVLKGLDHEEKAKGIESYKYVYIDELNHFTKAEYEQFILSLRGIEGQKVLASWNPVDENSWIKTEVIDKTVFVDCSDYGILPCEDSFIKKSTDGKTILIKTTFMDNFWIVGSPCGTYGYRDENLISEYYDLRYKNPNSYNVNVLGEWGVTETSNPFASEYSPLKHESEQAIFKEDIPIRISIDFNLNPFAVTFSHMWRDKDGEHLHVFDEGSISMGSIPKMVDFIKTRYGKYLHRAEITGDAMGDKRDISQRDNASLYLQLIRGLGMRESQLKLVGNPTHENSRADVNYILFKFPDFKINPKTCPNTCMDMRTVQVDAFGSIMKRNRNDLTQRADHLDTIRYLINTFLKDWINSNTKRNS